jgi:hypothetical protein
MVDIERAEPAPLGQQFVSDFSRVVQPGLTFTFRCPTAAIERPTPFFSIQTTR